MRQEEPGPKRNKQHCGEEIKPCLDHWFFLRVSATEDAKIAINVHQTDPVQKNTKPRTRNDKAPRLETGSMNCGRKAKKKSATFGFSRFVISPWR